MIVAYSFTPEYKFEKHELDVGGVIPKNLVWVDLLEPSIEEEKFLEKILKLDIPTREELDKLEVASPFYKEDDAYFMTVTAIHKIEKDYPEDTAIIFILHPRCLITVRYARPKAFTYFAARALKHPELGISSEVILEGLIESLVQSLADALEKTGNEIDELLMNVFEVPANFREYTYKRYGLKKEKEENGPTNTTEYYTYLIKRVGLAGNLLSKIRESLVSINRMLIFFAQIEETKILSKKEHKTRFRNLTREIHSITEYANFLAQRNSFLLDATLGMINVEQNKTIKLFTVATAVFLPPTLIASMYGMNFEYMPEINWVFGYPFALILIICSAALPFYYFKRRGLL